MSKNRQIKFGNFCTLQTEIYLALLIQFYSLDNRQKYQKSKNRQVKFGNFYTLRTRNENKSAS